MTWAKLKETKRQAGSLWITDQGRLRGIRALVFVLYSYSIATPPLQASTYDTWIQQAREGRYTEALAGLQQYHREHAESQRVQLDLIRVHYWAGHVDEMLRLYESLPDAIAVASDVLLYAARAYRDSQQWDRALVIYKEGKRRFNTEPQFTSGLCMTLADAGRFEEARHCVNTLTALQPATPSYLLTLSYVFRASGQPYEALRASQDALELKPNDPEVIRNHAAALQAARLYRQARDWQRQHHSLFTTAEHRSRSAEYAAELTRLGSAPTRILAEQHHIANRAIQIQSDLIDSAKEDESPLFLKRLQGDRLIAKDTKEELIHVDPRIDYPAYAYGALGALQLRARKPEEAITSYEHALSDANIDAKTQIQYQTGLAFALLESGQEEQATALAENMQSSTPPHYRLRGNPALLPNPDYTDALILKNTLYTYTGQLKKSRNDLNEALIKAPRNTNIRLALADAQRLSKMPRQAEHNLKIIENVDPLHVDMLISQAQTALDLQEYAQAKERIDYLQATFPTNFRVEELKKDWQDHNSNELILRSGIERGKGADLAGQDGLSMEAQWYGAPWNYHWRPTVVAGQFYTDDEQGQNISWQGGGLEWRSRSWRSLLAVQHQRSAGRSTVGVKAETDYDVNDHWRIGATLDYRSLDIPNRAVANSISANKAQVRLEYQNGPEQWIHTAYSAKKFSDHNLQHSLQLKANQRLYTSARLAMDMQVEVWAVTNKAIDAAYFNPRREYMAVPVLRLEHLLYQRYEKRITHALNVGAGLHHQQGYGNGGVVKAGYEVNYQMNRKVAIGLGINALSRPYDGKRERQTSGVFELKIKF